MGTELLLVEEYTEETLEEPEGFGGSLLIVAAGCCCCCCCCWCHAGSRGAKPDAVSTH